MKFSIKDSPVNVTKSEVLRQKCCEVIFDNIQYDKKNISIKIPCKIYSCECRHQFDGRKCIKQME